MKIRESRREGRGGGTKKYREKKNDKKKSQESMEEKEIERTKDMKERGDRRRKD